jgi:hypothetical protein
MKDNLKCYVITISKNFPASHPKKGIPTFFGYKIMNDKKIHTIRSNYDLWKKRIDQITAGKAYLSVREWSGKPYASKQVELFRFHACDKIGVEKLEQPDNFVFAPIEGEVIDWEVVAENDGLIFADFCNWFKKRQKEPMAIIHFTGFRYNNSLNVKQTN